MKRTLLSLFTLASVMLGITTSKADHLSDRLTFAAHLQPAAGVTSNGNGVAAFMLNSTHDTLYFTISAAKLTSAINGYHIHNNRTGGNVIIDFDGKVFGNTVRSFITGSQLTSLMADFIQGNLYVAVHTTMNPAVEIFGFVKLESDWGYAASLDGTQAGTSSTAVGHASVNFGMKGDTAVVKVVTNLSNKITGAHLHFGKMGQSGGIALHLEDLIAMDSMSMVGGVMITTQEWTDLAAALMADSVYLNLHTAANPGGEIRGQVRTTANLRFDAWLNSAAITAGGGSLNKPSTGYGVSTLWLSNSMDTLKYNVMFSGLTSLPNAAHFHNAEANASGGVVKEVTVSGNMISGMWTMYDAQDPLTSSLLSQLLMGNLYLVVHTDSNPGGEIRGQVYRLAREGFIAELNGAQASTNSGGQGTAVASYDRDRTNLHCMVTFDGLQGTASAGHIHFGKKGESGAVAMDLDPFTNNGSYKYLKAADGFNDATSIPMRRNDSTYINIHTSVFANGEIRGQLMRYYRISSETMDTITTGVNTVSINQNSLRVYPNPAINTVNVDFESSVTGEASVIVYNITGTEISRTSHPLLKGNNRIPVDLNNAAKGLYFINLSVNGETVSSMKLVKQ